MSVCFPLPVVASPSQTRERGSERFCRYVEALSTNGSKKRTPYPGLGGPPWRAASEFPIVADLEHACREIAAEARAVDPSQFHQESEDIPRAGSWDVFMLYERGRKLIANCEQCPQTTRIIEKHATVRTLAGLIYFSRLRPGTHIAPHRGPTNIRLRCHLGLDIPAGDCALRVERETRRWAQDRCIVFDDSYEHEAWNETRSDRLVLIVDLWHPGLSAEEIVLLQGMHHFAFVQAYSLKSYWAGNARMRRESGYD